MSQRVISSREPDLDSTMSVLFEIMYLIDDTLEKPHTDYLGSHSNEEYLLENIGEGVVELAIKYANLQDQVVNLESARVHDIISLAAAEKEITNLQEAVETLGEPPATHQKEFEEAKRFFLSQQNIKMTIDPNTLQVEYVLDEAALDEALQGALEMYNLQHLSKI
jgi:hypothetical protein